MFPKRAGPRDASGTTSATASMRSPTSRRGAGIRVFYDPVLDRARPLLLRAAAASSTTTRTFDPAAFGIMPVAAQGAEPDQLLALQVAVAAIGDAGYAERDVRAGERTSVILGRGNYLGARAWLRLVTIRSARPSSSSTRCASCCPTCPTRSSRRSSTSSRRAAASTAPTPRSASCPTCPLRGSPTGSTWAAPAYTVDAACASALVAVDQACRELRAGDADVVIAGGRPPLPRPRVLERVLATGRAVAQPADPAVRPARRRPADRRGHRHRRSEAARRRAPRRRPRLRGGARARGSRATAATPA